MARGESPTREDLAKRVAVECSYKIGTAKNLVKSSERMGLIKCSGRGRESLCKPVREHYHDVAGTLEIILNILDSWRYLDEIDLRRKGISEEAIENALTHVVSRDRNSLAVARGVIRWLRKFEELRQQIYIHTLLLDNFVQNLRGREAEVIVDEFRRLGWEVPYWSFLGPHRFLEALDRMSDMVVKGELTSRQLDELEGVAPRSIGVLRVTVMVKRETPILAKALLKLQEKVNKLKEVIRVVLHHYRKEMRVQGFCSYCVKEVSKEIKNIVKNLWKAIYIAHEAKFYHDLPFFHLTSEPLTSLSSNFPRSIILGFLQISAKLIQ
jgi:hypothetical protein